MAETITLKEKFCNSMDAIPPMGAFTVGVFGMILIVIPFMLMSPQFASDQTLKTILDNIAGVSFICGVGCVLFVGIRLGIYPVFKYTK